MNTLLWILQCLPSVPTSISMRSSVMGATVEVKVPHSPADAEVGETLSQYAWYWRLI